jgi:hypothetical protein
VHEWSPPMAKRIIFMTGDTVSPATRDFLQSCGNPVLVKPFPLPEVRRVVARLLEP